MSDTTDGVRKFEYNGREYVLHKLPSTKAVRLSTRLVKLFGNTVVQMLFGAAGRTKTEDVRKMSRDELASILSNLQVFGNLEDDAFIDLERLVFQYVWVDKHIIYNGKDSDLDSSFEGYEIDALRVLWEAIAYNLRPIIPADFLRSIRIENPAESVQ